MLPQRHVMEHAGQKILRHTKNLSSQSTDASLYTTEIQTSMDLLWLPDMFDTDYTLSWLHFQVFLAL